MGPRVRGDDERGNVAATYSFPGLKSSLGAAGAAMPSGRGPCGRRRRRGKRSPPRPSSYPPGAPFTCGCGPVMKEGRRSTPPPGSAITGCGADVGLRLLRGEARLLADMREALAIVVAVFRRRLHFGVDARLRLVLPELLLRGCDQAEIMFGVLVVVLGRDRVA